jgi:hypothetical protein
MTNYVLSTRLKVSRLILFTQPPNSVLDVIDGGFWANTNPRSSGCSLRSSNSLWNSSIRRSRAAITVLLASPRFCWIVAAFFSGKNDVPHPDSQRYLFLRACRSVSAGKGFNQWIFSHGSPSTISAGFLLDCNANEGILLEDYFKPAIQSHNGQRSSSSIASHFPG